MPPRMEVPTLEAQALARVHLVGGEKGGVGKSLLATLLVQHCLDQQLPLAAFDTDRSHGALLRHFSEHTTAAPVDRWEALDAIIESAIEQPGRRVVVDLAAQTQDALARWMSESGVPDLADLSGIALQYWHVMDGSRDGVDLLARLLDRHGQRLHYVVVKNQLRGDDFGQLERSGQLARAQALGARVITLRHLHDPLMQKLDAAGQGFAAARNGSPALGLLERQRLKLWLAHAFAEIARAGV